MNDNKNNKNAGLLHISSSFGNLLGFYESDIKFINHITSNHHCENPVLGDFSVSSPKFFFARLGGMLPLLGAEGPQKWVPRAEGVRFTKIFVIFEGICALKRCSERDFDQKF